MPRRAGIGGIGHGVGVQGSLAGRQAAQVALPPAAGCRGRCTSGARANAFAPCRHQPHPSSRACAYATVRPQERAHDVGARMAVQHREQMVEQSKLFKVAPRAPAVCHAQPLVPGERARLLRCARRTRACSRAAHACAAGCARITCRLCPCAACCLQTAPPAGPPRGVCPQAQGRNHQEPRLSQQVQQHVHGDWRRSPWFARTHTPHTPLPPSMHFSH